MFENKTSDSSINKAVYMHATTVVVSPKPNTITPGVDARTVSTSCTEGVVHLRYAPRTPKASGETTTTP
jgi:hypothetical protein